MTRKRMEKEEEEEEEMEEEEKNDEITCGKRRVTERKGRNMTNTQELRNKASANKGSLSVMCPYLLSLVIQYIGNKAKN